MRLKPARMSRWTNLEGREKAKKAKEAKGKGGMIKNG